MFQGVLDRFSEIQTPRMLRNLFLMEIEITLLTQARSEFMKQEQKVESLNWCVSELQQQTYANRKDLESAHHRDAESRREQVRPQEELAIKEKAIRDAQIRSMHKMEEMKRTQELRVDEFSIEVERKSWNHTEALFTNTTVARKNKLF